MCGRGGHEFSWQQVYEYLELPGPAPEGGMRWLNVAPSTRRSGQVLWTRLPVVVAGDDGRELRHMVWPLIPPWLKGELPKFSTANCRSEAGQAFSKTVAGKPAFRNAWKKARRCLVPFSWFYEWDQRTRPRQPWRVRPADQPMLALAGLWDRSTDGDGQTVESFTLVTTEPCPLLSDIGHHRAPCIPDTAERYAWLEGSVEEAQAVIHPPADDGLVAEQVTTRVNNPTYQGEDLRPELR